MLACATLLSRNAWTNEELWEIELLMQLLSEVDHAKLDFIETKQSILLVTDVTLEGKLDYRSPGFIEKVTISPFYERVTVDGDSMIIEKSVKVGKDDNIQQIQEYSVESHPLLKAAVESIQAMLAGDFTMLTENYILHLDGERESWQLNLVPKSAEILEHIEQINLAGVDTEIREIVTIQADGDESKMELTYQLLE
jgi:hypothetical protein